jgi:hypothetical protein
MKHKSLLLGPKPYGSVGDITLDASRYVSPYAKVKPQPVDPMTTAQLLQRSRLASLNTLWHAAKNIEANKTAWNRFAKHNHPKLSGYTQFLSIYRPIQTAGASLASIYRVSESRVGTTLTITSYYSSNGWYTCYIHNPLHSFISKKREFKTIGNKVFTITLPAGTTKGYYWIENTDVPTHRGQTGYFPFI